MTLGQLRTFLALAATGSVRAAAERLVVTQPAVSAAVASLQQEVGVALVVREGRGLRLTAAGEVFADYARRALGLLDEGTAAALSADEPERGHLRLAAVTSAGERLTPSLLASFVTRHPGIEVSLEVGNRRRVWDLLAHHEADLAIGGRPPATATTLASRPHQLVVVANHRGEAHPARRRRTTRTVALTELTRATWLLREPGSGTRAATEELLAQLDISPPVLTLGSTGAVIEGVRIGLGITLLSRDAVDEYLLAGALDEWRYGPLPLERAWHLAAAANKPIAPTAHLFLEHLLQAGWRRA